MKNLTLETKVSMMVVGTILKAFLNAGGAAASTGDGDGCLVTIAIALFLYSPTST